MVPYLPVQYVFEVKMGNTTENSHQGATCARYATYGPLTTMFWTPD